MLKRSFHFIIIAFLLMVNGFAFTSCDGIRGNRTLNSTELGNPMTSLAIASFSSSSSFNFCLANLILKSPNKPDYRVGFQFSEERLITATGTELESVMIPQGNYTQILLELSDSCSSGRSLGVVNVQGSFNSAQTMALDFIGEVTIDSVPRKITFYMQSITDNLDTVAADKEVVSKATASAGALANLDTWYATTTLNAPAPRDWFPSVWTGTEMIVWGGAMAANDGGRYNPVTDSWTSITTTGAPIRRYGDATWTGTEMIVSVAYTGAVYVNDGGRYNPVSDSWASVTTVGAPSPREGMNFVWIGSEMIAWGGWNNVVGSYYNDGYRYSPSTNTWTPMTTTSAPVPRIFSQAAWTGSRVIFWGGNTTLMDNSGGLYDPSTDSWTATTTANAPSSGVLQFACSAWTGTEMLVWGGQNYTTTFNLGGRYNPSTDTWTSMTTTGAPSSRQSMSCAWTGSKLITWGGCADVNCTNPLSSGGKYDAATNTWTATTTLGAPARRSTMGVWTGREMIVWGGRTTGGVYLNSGGRYTP